MTNTYYFNILSNAKSSNEVISDIRPMTPQIVRLVPLLIPIWRPVQVGHQRRRMSDRPTGCGGCNVSDTIYFLTANSTFGFASVRHAGLCVRQTYMRACYTVNTQILYQSFFVCMKVYPLCPRHLQCWSEMKNLRSCSGSSPPRPLL